MAQLVKNPLATQETQETWVWSHLEDPLGEEMAKPIQYSYLLNPMDRGAWQAAVQRITRKWTQLSMHANYILDKYPHTIYLLLRRKSRSRVPSSPDMTIVRGLVLRQHAAYSKSCLWLSSQGWWMCMSGLPTSSNAFSFLNNTFI